MKGYFTERIRVWFERDGVHIEASGGTAVIQLCDLDLAIEMLMRQGNDLSGYKNSVHTTEEDEASEQ